MRWGFLAVFQASYKRATFRASLFIGVFFVFVFTNSYFLIFIIYNLSSLVFNVFTSL